MECIVKVKQLQIEENEVTAVIETFDGRKIEPEPQEKDAPIKRIEIRLKRGDRVDLPIRVFKRLGTSVIRYVPPTPTLEELEALEAAEAAKLMAGPPETKAKGK
jgi:hypothetical protein